MDEWPKQIIQIPSLLHASGLSVRQLFEPALTALATPEIFRSQVSEQLRLEPELVKSWLTYSEDKRSSPSPYLTVHDTGYEVGFFDSRNHAVKTYADPIEACVDFVHREAAWVTGRTRID
jgi:hypothetical protein